MEGGWRSTRLFESRVEGRNKFKKGGWVWLRGAQGLSGRVIDVVIVAQRNALGARLQKPTEMRNQTHQNHRF